MSSARAERVESVYLSYLPAEGDGDDNNDKDSEGGGYGAAATGSGNKNTPYVTVTAPQPSPPVPATTVTSPIMDNDADAPAALRRPLHLGIATAAANTAAREQSRVQQKLQQSRAGGGGGGGGSSPMRTNFPPSPHGNSNNNINNVPSPSSSRFSPPHQARAHPPSSYNNATNSAPFPQAQAQARAAQPQAHVPSATTRQQFQPSQQQQQQQQMRIGNGGGSPPPHQQQHQQMRPLQLRANPAQMPQQAQPPPQQMRSGRPGAPPALKVTVPPPVHQRSPHRHPQPHSNSPHRQQASPPSPFSSSVETLVGSPLNPNKNGNKGFNSSQQMQGKPANWSPSSSSGSSGTAHGAHLQSPGPYGHAHRYDQGPPLSPSIKNLQLQVPNHRMADPENDRLSPAMPSSSSSNGQKDFWKRFSTVVRENEKSQQMAEKTGAKGSKAESEWLDKQRHRMRNYRIWVWVVAFIILAAIGGGLAYHFLTKKDSDANTQPTTHDVSPGEKDTTTASALTNSSTAPMTMAQPSAVPAGNVIGSSTRAKREVVGAADAYSPLLTQPADVGRLAARSLNGNPRLHNHALWRRRLSDMD